MKGCHYGVNFGQACSLVSTQGVASVQPMLSLLQGLQSLSREGWKKLLQEQGFEKRHGSRTKPLKHRLCSPASLWCLASATEAFNIARASSTKRMVLPSSRVPRIWDCRSRQGFPALVHRYSARFCHCFTVEYQTQYLLSVCSCVFSLFNVADQV